MKQLRVWIIPVLQLAIAILFILLLYAVSWFGTTYTFQVSTYEPYDPYFNDSIYLEYDGLEGRQDVETGTVYVTFKEGEDGYAVIDRIQSKPFFGGVQGNYYDRFVYIEEISSYRVPADDVDQIEGKQSFTIQVDVAPWGMVRPHDLSPIQE
ncbi:GDYXXLXY domain-containing protein [Exiguobacterium algae]|uniref:GDYXXLXY domain-containing protein n=1 Tax=Exiguobacterium algae TaxID=2751250 RepID=UPI001BEC83D9|nr:GDYXXLXY domain-containing protein [Exiguobacterium algae]